MTRQKIEFTQNLKNEVTFLSENVRILRYFSPGDALPEICQLSENQIKNTAQAPLAARTLMIRSGGRHFSDDPSSTKSGAIGGFPHIQSYKYNRF